MSVEFEYNYKTGCTSCIPPKLKRDTIPPSRLSVGDLVPVPITAGNNVIGGFFINLQDLNNKTKDIIVVYRLTHMRPRDTDLIFDERRIVNIVRTNYRYIISKNVIQNKYYST